MSQPGPAYWDYLKLDRLLDLQGGVEEDESQLMPDELHFIIVHQAYELWFKLVLRELRDARDHLAAPKVAEEKIPYVVHHIRRVTEIMKLAVDQFRVMETLTPQDFLAFRDKLIPASGFQSFQLRELEILLGLDDKERIAYAGVDPLEHIRQLAQKSPTGELAWKRIEKARSEQTLRAAMHEWLYRTPVQGSGPNDAGDSEAVERFISQYFAELQRSNAAKVVHMLGALGGDGVAIKQRIAEGEAAAKKFLFAEDVPEAERERVRRVRAGVLFIESYRELPLLAWPRLLIDSVVELEAHLVIFRSRHARMVERIIGRRVGTGGSSGVDYLDQTARYRIFDELWSVRTILLAKEQLPALEHSEVYGFAS
ncbi:MAG: tryptophan 2,3-dioxygenase [Myxococcales bacterium]|nr:tryptophan 2,3-dioxygenase [Myxococcales bacterium]